MSWTRGRCSASPREWSDKTLILHNDHMSTWLGLSPDTALLFAAIIGAALGALVTYWVGKRQWWTASGAFATSAALLLDMVTEDKSGSVHNAVVLAAWPVSFAYLIIVRAVDKRAKRAAG
jgi:hypothetical protein